MKLRCFKWFCVAVMLCGLAGSAVAGTATPADFTGNEWQRSSTSEKLAFLYGVSSTVAIEHLVAERQGTEESVFVAAWLKAFGKTCKAIRIGEVSQLPYIKEVIQQADFHGDLRSKQALLQKNKDPAASR